jgi:hypothetical protein
LSGRVSRHPSASISIWRAAARVVFYADQRGSVTVTDEMLDIDAYLVAARAFQQYQFFVF